MSDPTPEALKMHAAACERGETGYTDPHSGLFVMTSVYLLQRGNCCGKGCRHCPWPEDVQDAAGRPAGVAAWPWEGLAEASGEEEDEEVELS